MQQGEHLASEELSNLLRVEDAYLLRGKGQFLDDLPTATGTLFAAIVRSPIAHGLIREIREQPALQIPGVRAVLLPQDVQAWSDPFVVSVKTSMKQWSLAIDRVRYVGEPVAVVIADSRALAEDGVDAIEVEYETLEAVTDPRQSLASNQVLLHPELGTNCIVDRQHEYGDVNNAFATAAHVVCQEFVYPRNSCTPMECGGVIAQYHAYSGAYTVTSNFMGPFSMHVVMAAALRIPGNKLRHHYPQDSGGSFGVKQAMLPYVVLTALASRKAGAPVKFMEDRLEHLVALTSATARSTTLKAAVDQHGKILALDYDQIEDCGAYLRAPEPATLYRMHGCMTGAYDITHLRVRNRVVLVNKTPTGLVRGFGGPQVYFALERLLQKIAAVVGKTVPEINRLNYVRADQFPYQAAAGGLYDSGDYIGALNELESHPAYQALLTKQADKRSKGRLYGIGFASVIEPSISNMGYITTVLTPEQRAKAGPKNGAIATATVSVDASGAVNVVVASAPAGQGHQTVLAELVGEQLGLSREQIVVNTELDTAKDAWSAGSGNYSSRFAGAVAGAAFLAASKIREKITAYAASLFACSPEDVRFQHGRVFSVNAPEQAISFARIAGTFHWAPALTQAAMRSDIEPGLRETVHFCPTTLQAPDAQDRINTSATYGFVLDVCGIEIDPVTCRAVIDQYITVHDAGRLLSPQLADGQIYGAYAQGVGAALYEEFSYDEAGNFLSGTFADYRLPTAHEIPTPLIVHRETPSPFTPLGAKGIAEGNNMSTPVCIANAIADAIGYEDIHLPATPSKLHHWLVKAGHLSVVAAKVSTAQADRQTSGDLIQARGDMSFSATPESIFDVLLNPERLARVIPGCERITQKTLGDKVLYDCRVTLRLGVIKAGFDARIELSEINRPQGLRLAGKGNSILGLAQGSGLVSLTRHDQTTTLSYHYQASVSGKLAAIGGRLLEASARVVLNQLFKALAQEAEGKRAGQSFWSAWLAKITGMFK